MAGDDFPDPRSLPSAEERQKAYGDLVDRVDAAMLGPWEEAGRRPMTEEEVRSLLGLLADRIEMVNAVLESLYDQRRLIWIDALCDRVLRQADLARASRVQPMTVKLGMTPELRRRVGR